MDCDCGECNCASDLEKKISKLEGIIENLIQTLRQVDALSSVDGSLYRLYMSV